MRKLGDKIEINGEAGTVKRIIREKYAIYYEVEEFEGKFNDKNVKSYEEPKKAKPVSKEEKPSKKQKFAQDLIDSENDI